MRYALAVLTLMAAIPLAADARTEKRRLIGELLEVMDARRLTQRSFDTMFEMLRRGVDHSAPELVPDELREQWELERKREEEQVSKFRERLFTRIDYARYADEIYVPLLDERFTSDELRELIAFFRTRMGQKMASAIPELAGDFAKGREMLMVVAEETADEIRKEELAATPWIGTMADMRSIATAVESRATDTNDYANVAFEELEGLLAPTYIRELPKVDGWGTPYFYVSNREHYRIVSAGADRRFDWSSRQIDLMATDPRPSADADADIIFQDGSFIQFPAESSPEP